MNKHIVLKEWETVRLLYELFIIDDEDKVISEIEIINNKRILEIELLRKEVKISSNSHVGEIKLGSYLITIEPKIKALDFIKMFNYTYNFTDLNLLTDVDIGKNIDTIKDIFIYKLIMLGRNLLIQPNRNYEKITQNISTMKGRINFRDIINQGGELPPKISCTYFERIDNNHLNRIVFSLIVDLAYLTDNSYLINLSRKLKKETEDLFEKISVSMKIIKKALLSLNRLNQRYEEFLRLALMFIEGIAGLDNQENINKIDGFYINMNKLFQDFIGKFTQENMEDYILKEEYSLKNMFKYIDNPLAKNDIYPRPDFVIFKDNNMKYILDAKYRDLWEKPLPREMLYQLSLYSLSGIENKKSRIIYPSNKEAAKLQVISIKDIVTNVELGKVEIQPISIIKILETIECGVRDRKSYVKNVILGVKY